MAAQSNLISSHCFFTWASWKKSLSDSGQTRFLHFKRKLNFWKIMLGMEIFKCFYFCLGLAVRKVISKYHLNLMLVKGGINHLLAENLFRKNLISRAFANVKSLFILLSQLYQVTENNPEKTTQRKNLENGTRPLG